MAEWIILRLSLGREERASWMTADAAGQPLTAPQAGSLAQAAAAASGRHLMVIAPSTDVLLTEVELPVKSGVRVQQVVPYALEEQLAADIETLHFAVGARAEQSGRTRVAVVTRALMDQWLASLRSVGLEPELLCSEAELLPQNPGHVVVLLEGDTLCLCRPGQVPQTLPSLELTAALEAALGLELASDDLIFYTVPADWHRRSREIEALRARCASLKVQLLNYGPLPLLGPQIGAREYTNLLSADYAPKSNFAGGWQRWRLVAGLAAALLLIHVGGLSLQRVQQQRSEKVLDQSISDVARRAFPGDSGEGAVRERIEHRLLAAQAGTENFGLMGALAALAHAVEGTDNASVQALNFHDGGLDLQLKAKDAANLERINQSLRSSGWQAELVSGSASGSVYSGHILAHAPGTASGARASR
jgi:general secretion pathway protein L